MRSVMDREDAIDWNNKGYSLAGQGLHQDAITAYDRAISLDPSNPVFHKNKEKALRALKGRKKTKSRESQFEETIEPTPKTKQDYAIDRNNHAGALFKQGRIDEAILEYDRAISLDPTHPIFWKNKAKALNAAGRSEESELAHGLYESIQARNAICPSDKAIYWNNKGYSLAEEGNHFEAIDAFNHAIKEHPNFADAYNNLGYSLSEHGRIDEAITACYRAVELKPELAYSWIEKWLFLPELVQNPENIIPKTDLKGNESEDSGSLISSLICNHPSGPIEMEPVFICPKEKTEKFTRYGWVCPECGQYRKQ
jgi:tetratricopeptide (TPR) repeat protein